MIAKFKIELEDLIAAEMNAVATSKYHKKNKLNRSIIFTLLYIFFSLIAFDLSFSELFLYSTILFLASYYVTYKMLIAGIVKKSVVNNPSLLVGDCTVTISDEGLISELNQSARTVHWNQIVRATEDTERYFLYITDVYNIVIKKHPHHLSQEDMKEFNEAIHRHLQLADVDIKKV